mmetsp:Transcript_46073/g.111599  ORF Transcript_46073/g.111599 Transcript_46073/m.111599 type:complete len:136 (-) Transcript_46073:1017-1424(-)
MFGRTFSSFQWGRAADVYGDRNRNVGIWVSDKSRARWIFERPCKAIPKFAICGIAPSNLQPISVLAPECAWLFVVPGGLLPGRSLCRRNITGGEAAAIQSMELDQIQMQLLFPSPTTSFYSSGIFVGPFQTSASN